MQTNMPTGPGCRLLSLALTQFELQTMASTIAAMPFMQGGNGPKTRQRAYLLFDGFGEAFEFRSD